MGGGYLISTLRDDVQRNIGFDFHFHIRRQYFQAGILMSGAQFLANNNIELRMGYGLRREKNKTNLAIFTGITYFTGVRGVPDSLLGSVPLYYQGVGAYFCAQAITKITYDIGVGLEFFGEYSQKQQILGLKFLMYFSGAYKGVKKNYNPHVHSENNK